MERRASYLHEGSLDNVLEGLLDRHGARLVDDLDLLDLLDGSVGSGVRHCDGLLPLVFWDEGMAGEQQGKLEG